MCEVLSYAELGIHIRIVVQRFQVEAESVFSGIGKDMAHSESVLIILKRESDC